ncbi:MAG: winged helix-turn-helix transcriptional regulator [Hydrococcus sp. Prado102]|nr:winged helix-turn-helix transcriptional regulator [Hydrococcus sp. Prado102]
MSILIISATPGPKTTERILELILAHPQGIKTKELSDRLNRPVSMVNICLKSLIASKQVRVRLSDNGMQQIYYPKSVTISS